MTHHTSSHSMIEPSLIIGLGEVGRLVLELIKADLLEPSFGNMPSHIKLLILDTAPNKSPYARGLEIKPKGISTNVTFKWFTARHYLDQHILQVGDLSDGRGRVRQFGRIALFRELLHPSSLSKSIVSAIKDLLAESCTDREMDVMIIGALKGDMGADMFLNVAYLVRLITQTIGCKAFICGCLIISNLRLATSQDQIHSDEALSTRNSELRKLSRPAPDAMGLVFDACVFWGDTSESGSLTSLKSETPLYQTVIKAMQRFVDTMKGAG